MVFVLVIRHRVEDGGCSVYAGKFMEMSRRSTIKVIADYHYSIPMFSQLKHCIPLCTSISIGVADSRMSEIR